MPGRRHGRRLSLSGFIGTRPLRFYTRIRTVIAEETQKASSVCGEIEVDESYFGGRRKGKRGRGAGGKVPVFGLLKRGGRVYTVMIPNARTDTLMPIMERLIQPDSIVYTDGFSSYDALDVSDFHHVRINHSERFVDERNHINGIENFWKPGKAASSALQRGAQTEFSPLPEGVRMALQWR